MSTRDEMGIVVLLFLGRIVMRWVDVKWVIWSIGVGLVISERALRDRVELGSALFFLSTPYC